VEKDKEAPYCALADFIARRDSGIGDFIGAFAVTAGIGAREFSAEFADSGDDYSAIMVLALADRLAEAFAEFLHKKVRMQYWGYAEDENLSNDELIAEKYTGIRPAPGYPTCPDHYGKNIIFNLLNVTENTGITLTESSAMFPAASVAGFYFAHPESSYFNIGRIGTDQLADYAGRMQIPENEIRKNLAHLLI
jgi:5-methyltetrahydrofolate--homocysteine methyltransferase